MTTDLRERYIAALIAHAEAGNLDDGFLDRIERLLDQGSELTVREAVSLFRIEPYEGRHQLIEPQAPVVDPPVDTATPEPAHEDAQEAEEAENGPPLAQVDRGAEPPAPSPAPTAIGKPKPEYFCVKGCGRKVSGEGRKCQPCNGQEASQRAADRRAARDAAAIVARAVTPESYDSGSTPPNEGGTPPELAEPTRVVNVKTGAASELPACTCLHQFAVDGLGHWHDPDCPRHTHKFPLPPAAGLDGLTHEMTCVGCPATKLYEPAPTGYGASASRNQHSAAVTA